MRVALYARVSTDDQNADIQLSQLRKFCRQRGYTIHSEYVDHSTGTNTARPGFMELMDNLPPIDAVVVWKLDRFSRSVRDLYATLGELKAQNVDFIAVSDNIDMTTPTGRFMMTILAAVAELEASLISQRTKEALAHLKAQGKRLGPKPVAQQRIDKYVELHGPDVIYKPCTCKELAKEIGVSAPALSRWKKRNRTSTKR